jgi:nitrile hydratase
MMGFGPIVDEPEVPVFHSEWERRAFAITLAAGAAGGWTIDQARQARESLHPARYLSMTYYEIWIAGLERLLTERGLVSGRELEEGRCIDPAKVVERRLEPGRVDAMIARGGPTFRPDGPASRFFLGQRVRARNSHPSGHTRLPRYARGRCGTITHCHGSHVLADVSAAGGAEVSSPLYTVRFSGEELWGEGGDPRLSVSIDAFEVYLEPVA